MIDPDHKTARPAADQLKERYKSAAAEYGDAMWRLRHLQAYIADAEKRMAALENEYSRLEAPEAK